MNNSKLYVLLFITPLILSILLCHHLDIYANIDKIVITDNQDEYYLGTHMEYLEDKTKSLDIETITKDNLIWNKSKHESPGFGFSSSVYWIRFTLDNQSKNLQELYLEVFYPMLDNIILYIPDNKAKFNTVKAGDQYPFNKRIIKYRNFIFPIKIINNTVKTYYMRFESESSMNIPLKIWNPHHFNEFINNEQLIVGFYYGSMVILVLYNLLLFISIRNRNYLFYILFIASYILFQLTLNGLAFQYLWPQSVRWANISLPFFIFFANIWLQLFNKTFLNTKKITPLFNKLFISILIISIIGTVVTFFIKYSISIYIGTITILISVILMLINSYISLYRGYRPARIYVIAWTSFLIGIAVYALKTLGVMPNSFITNWSIQIGSLLVVVLLSLSLADQINILRQEKTDALTKLNEAYSRFVPHEFLKLLEKESVLDVQLGDQIQRDIIILFSDIRSFTSLSESMSPRENINFLNSYLKRISPIIRNNNGFIDKYIGDAIMALFPTSTDDALQAAIEMQKELITYNSHREKSGYIPISIGIGLHGGTVMLGTIGEEKRIDGTVIADNVNLASRIEELTKVFGASIIISEKIFLNLKDPTKYNFRFLGKVKVKGKNEMISIFEIFDGDLEIHTELKTKYKDDFEQGLLLYYQEKYTEAGVIFKKIAAINPNDQAVNYYYKQILQNTNSNQKDIE